MATAPAPYKHQVTIDGIADFLEFVNSKQTRWRQEFEYLAGPWFRGVANSGYNLVPSYHRFAARYPNTTEDDLRDEFVRRAHPMVERIPTDHWEWYFLMQHYDLPTRLLDWSFSSLVGLFFAVYDYRMLKADWTRSIDVVPDTDAAVWMMDSETLNRNTLGSTFSTVEPIPRFDSLFVASYLTSRPFNTAQWPPDPVAILPAYTNRRLVAQKGTFVLFGASSRHLGDMPIWETSTGPRLIQLIIPKEKVPAIRSALLNAGITAALLFPELSIVEHRYPS
jgi:hypothetical protein